MKIIRYPQFSPLGQPSCVTIGNFDGIHLGHQALIKQVVSYARAHQSQAVVVTMQPLPQQYFNGKYAAELLTGFSHKATLLEAMGVDVICVLNFNRNLANMSPSDFYQKILKYGLTSQAIFVGDDFRFGADRMGDFKQLQAWGQQDGIEVQRMNSVYVNDCRVSSTLIRESLKSGAFSLVRQLLGRHFNLIGRVAHGRKMGRKIGYPTINLELKFGGYPLHGVYMTHIKIDGEYLPSMTSVGMNPTVGGNAKRAEVHVFDFDRDVYGKTVEVLFYKKLRNEVEFDSLNDLIVAIEQDVCAGQDFFASFKGELV